MTVCAVPGVAGSFRDSIFPKCIRLGMQAGFCSSLLLACCRQRPDKKLFLCFILSSVAWKVFACIVAMVFLFLALKNPSCCHLVSILQLEGSFLLVYGHMSGSCHKLVLEEISLSFSISPLFLCFDCDGVCGKWNGMTWNYLRYRACCRAKLGVKFGDGKEIEDGGPASLQIGPGSRWDSRLREFRMLSASWRVHHVRGDRQSDGDVGEHWGSNGA